MRIAFLCGGFGISGGMYVILQHALFLKMQGHDITLVTLFKKEDFDFSWHPAFQKFHLLSLSEVTDDFDILTATWWCTVYDLSKIKAKKYAYFVQSIESRFVEKQENKLAHYIEGTYFFGLPVITEASWIVKYLEEKTNTDFIALVRNGIRKDFYTLAGPTIAPRVAGKLRVLVEGPTDVFFKNVPKTIELCKKSEADEVWLLTSSRLSHYPGVDRVFSQVPIDKTAEIYRSCDVLIKLSYVEGMFGPPLEMFHCGGTAIVYDVTGHDEYIKHNENALVAQKDDEVSVINYLNTLKRDKNLLDRLKKDAIATARQWPDWSETSAIFSQALLSLPEQSVDSQRKLGAMQNYLNHFFSLSNESDHGYSLSSLSVETFKLLLKNKLKKYVWLNKCVYKGLYVWRKVKKYGFNN